MGPAITITPPARTLPPPPHPAIPSTRSRSEQVKASASTFPICLVTGGAGYIGSHTVLELLTAGFAVVVLDNLCNSHLESLCRVHYIARTEFERCGETSRPVPSIFFHQVDIRDAQRMNGVFSFWSDPKATLDPERLPVDVGAMVAKKAYPMLEYKIDSKKRTQPSPLMTRPDAHGKVACVIHFAALQAVGESLSMPLEYYETNVAGLLILLKAMKTNKINTFVFSSSAVVYGMGHGEAITEEAVQIAGKGNGGGLLTDPYVRTKWMSEEIINDFCVANSNFHATSLRCFNPTGAHSSSLIGENPKGTPNNIVPVILQAYERHRSRGQVFGSSYDTPDGTGVRDYIHVSDLAKGHLAVLRKAVHDQGQQPADNNNNKGKAGPPPPVPGALYHVYNFGTVRGYSVLEIIQAFFKAAGTVTASPDKAATELDWTAESDLQDMCRDAYHWAAANPGGYEKLRRLSVLSVLSGSQLRKASIASHLFKSEDEFESFVAGTHAAAAASREHSVATAAGHRASIASITSLLVRTRVSISSNSSYEDKFGFSATTSSLTGSDGISPISPMGGLKQPRFFMNWSSTPRKNGQAHTELQPPIEEEKE